MLDFPREIKDLFMKDNISPATHRKVKLVFYKKRTEALYPRENLYPEETLYPAEHREEDLLMVIENDRIESESLVITESLSESENLDFGSCNSSMVEIIVANVEEDLTGKEFELIIGVGGYEVILGKYTVRSFVRQAERVKRKITAYDRMTWFDVDVAGWYETEKFPTTLKEFRKSLCEFVGIQEKPGTSLVNDDMVVEKTLETETLLGVDVLRCICQINGAFGNIDKEGKMNYITIPQKGDVTDRVSAYKSVEWEEYTVPDIDTVRIRKEEGDIGGTSDNGDGMNVLTVEGNFLVYGKTTSQQSEIANNILSVVSGLEYRPSKLIINGSPWHEVGDRIEVRTSDGVINTIIMSRVSSGIQNMGDEIGSSGSQELKQTFSVRTQVLEVKGLSAILNRTVEEVSNNLKNLENNTESNFIQTAKMIQAEVTRATKAEETLTGKISVEADRITAEATRATKAEGTLSARIEVNAKAITQRVTSAQAESLIEQKADSIRLKANAISWSSKNSSMTADGKLSCKEAIISGNITAGSGKIGGFEIDGDSLVSVNQRASIRWGDFGIDDGNAELGELYIEDYIVVGNLADVNPDVGDIVASGELWLGDPFWYGKDGRHWSVTETVEDIYNYVHGGGWNPCGRDSGCEIDCDCDGGDCDSPGCSGDTCGGDYPCHGDCSDCGSYNEGPGC